MGTLAAKRKSLTQWLSRHQVSVFFLTLALLFTVVFFFDRIFISIPAGHRGVLFKMFFSGTVEDRSYGEGLLLAYPWNQVELYDVRLQSLRVKVGVLSKEGLSIDVDTITRFMPNIERLGELHKRIGPEYVRKVVEPVITSSVREVVGNYGPEELYATGSAQKAEDEVTREIVRELAGLPIAVDDFVVEYIKLPAAINQAIEDKLRHQQALLSYEFRLKSAEAEIINRRLDAEGLAAYNKVVGASLTPNLLRWLGIQATQKLAESPNTKVLMFGGPDGLPVILNLEEKNQAASAQPPETAGSPGPPPAQLAPPPAPPAPPAPAAPPPGLSPGRPGQGQGPAAGPDIRRMQETRSMLEQMLKRFEAETPPDPGGPVSPGSR